MCLADATKRRVHSGAALVDGKFEKQCFPLAGFSIFNLILAWYPFAKFAVLCLYVRKETTNICWMCFCSGSRPIQMPCLFASIGHGRFCFVEPRSSYQCTRCRNP